MLRRLSRNLQQFGADRTGATLLYVTLLLPVVVGMGLLAMDYGRLATLETTSQKGADALALAGAGELDLRTDAIARSELAMTNLITSNTALFTTSAATINKADVTTCYLTSIPANDATPINSASCLSKANADLVASSKAARFVQVKVSPKAWSVIFPASFLGGTDSGTQGAEAVAGFQAAVCNFTPMFVCNPYEGANNTEVMRATELLDHFSDPAKRRRLINMKQTGGNSAQYFPGNFGWLVPASGSQGANELREQVGMASPPACFVANGVELRTGNIESVRFGFNTRFDMYDGPMNNKSGNVDFRPAQNVRKGMANDKTTGSGKGTACNPDDTDRGKLIPPWPTTGANKMPDYAYLFRDNCFYSNTCPNMGGRMGDGAWNRDLYWSKVHGGTPPPTVNGVAWADSSRYDVYRFELTNIATYVRKDSNNAPNGGEVGNPACYSGSATDINDNPDRRIFHGAILNCKALDAVVNGGPIQGGSAHKQPVVAFAQFFITEPLGGDKTNANVVDGDVWAEMIKMDLPGQANSVARDVVQLYR